MTIVEQPPKELDFFKLPIHYIENKKVIEEHIITDLELNENKENETKSL